MENETRIEILKRIALEKLKIKSKIEFLRGVSDITNESYENEMNEYLDALNRLTKLWRMY